MPEIVFLIEEVPHGGYIARAVGTAIFTDADTLPELSEVIQDAVRCHFAGQARPSAIRLIFVKEYLREEVLFPESHDLL